MAEQVFDIHAILAGSAEIYTTEPDTLPPQLGYPITTSQASTLGSLGVNETFTRGAGEVLWDGVGGTSLTIVPDVDLSGLEFTTHGSTPTLVVVVTGTAASGLKVLVGAARKSLYIQYFGRVAEFPFHESADPVAGAGANEFRYAFEIGNDSDANRMKAYALFQIPPTGMYTVRSADVGGRDSVTGYNSLWSRYGDGLISREAVNFSQNQTIERLEIAAVIPPVKLFRQGSESVLSFNCFSLSAAFVALLTGNEVEVFEAPQNVAGEDIGPAYQQVSVAQGSTVNEFGICLRMDDAPTEFGKQAQIYLPRVGVTGNITTGLARVPQGTPVEVASLYSALWETNALYMTQTNAWSITL